MASSTANTWVKFFVAAGIPSTTAAKYAHVFHENRIQMDMLGDLNKEYLREMGINTLGDIIAILRHSKSVYELNAQQLLLAQDNDCIVVDSSQPPPAAKLLDAVPSRKALSTTSASRASKSNGSTVVAAAANSAAATTATTTKTAAITADGKPARRVLPEHEGRYKITLPAGTTPRSKQILAKKAMLHSDQPNNGQRGIFDRLELNGGLTHNENSNGSYNSSGTDSPIITSTKITVTGLNKRSATTATTTTSASKSVTTVPAPTASIFRRLGGKTTPASTSTTSAARAAQPLMQCSFSGLLKRPVASASDGKVSLVAAGGGVAKKTQQKVILVKKQPAKATRPDDYDVLADDDDEMSGYAVNRSGSEKCVSFSEEDEVLEFASRKTTPRPKPPKPAASSVHAIVHVKDRLGFGTGKSEADASLHRTRKTVPLKPAADATKLRRPLLASPPMRSAAIGMAAAAASSSSGKNATTRLGRGQTEAGRQVRVPVHSRLTLGRSNSSGSVSGRPTAVKSSSGHRASVSSVFERLGFND